MILTKRDLISWLSGIDKKLKKKVTLIAIGGTAMILLNLKESTRDVDFCIEGESAEEMKKLVTTNKFKLDLFEHGFIFSEKLPPDYVSLAIPYTSFQFRNLILKTLNPIDLIITKAPRYNARDDEDIAVLAKSMKIDKKDLMARFNLVKQTFTAKTEDAEYNFRMILNRYFK